MFKTFSKNKQKPSEKKQFIKIKEEEQQKEKEKQEPKNDPFIVKFSMNKRIEPGQNIS
jgi:hypothetical protein